MMRDVTRRCENCGTPIPEAVNAQQIYCAAACREDYFNRIKREARRDRGPRACRECGGPIPTERNAAAMFCADACNKRFYKRRARAAHGRG